MEDKVLQRYIFSAGSECSQSHPTDCFFGEFWQTQPHTRLPVLVVAEPDFGPRQRGSRVEGKKGSMMPNICQASYKFRVINEYRLINRISSCFSLYVYTNDIVQQGVMNSWSMKLQLWYWRNQYHTCLHVWLQKAMCLGSILNISELILRSNCYLTKVPYWPRHPSAPQTPVQIWSVWLTGVVFFFFFFKKNTFIYLFMALRESNAGCIIFQTSQISHLKCIGRTQI